VIKEDTIEQWREKEDKVKIDQVIDVICALLNKVNLKRGYRHHII